MTIAYADGTTVEALLLSLEERVVRLAVAGDDDVRTFTCIDGQYRAENGQWVQLNYSSQNEKTAPVAEESHFICSGRVGRQLIGNLMSGSEMRDTGADPFFVFSAEKRRVRVTVVHCQYRRTGGHLTPQ